MQKSWMQRSRRLLIISLRYSESLRNAAESRESHLVEGDYHFGSGSGLDAKFWAVFVDLDAVGESLMSEGSSRLRRGLRFHRR